jgi:tetratricopeptide (TPR) repeat protein
MKFCSKCGSKCEVSANFCGSCGSPLTKTSKKNNIRLLPLFVIIIIGIIGSSILITYSDRFIGKKPTQSVSNHASANQKNPADDNQKIKELRAEIEINPKSISNLKALSAELWSLLPNEGDPSPSLVLEIIDTLSKVLVLDDKDSESLLMLANITFNQKVFTKSSEYFQKYLVLHPEDLEARSSYASTLTFLGRPKDAISELDKVLLSDPNAFKPLAFKAITLSQMEKFEEAKTIGTKALGFAPNDEARKRFQGFLDSLSGMRNQNKEPTIVTFLKSHQIVGPKVINFKVSEDTATVYLKNFPMEAMPPFVREKFDQTVTGKLSESGAIKHLKLVDNETQSVLATY